MIIRNSCRPSSIPLTWPSNSNSPLPPPYRQHWSQNPLSNILFSSALFLSANRLPPSLLHLHLSHHLISCNSSSIHYHFSAPPWGLPFANLSILRHSSSPPLVQPGRWSGLSAFSLDKISHNFSRCKVYIRLKVPPPPQQSIHTLRWNPSPTAPCSHLRVVMRVCATLRAFVRARASRSCPPPFPSVVAMETSLARFPLCWVSK